MGLTDSFIIPRYAHIVSDYVNISLEEGNKIAWLGQQEPGKYADMFINASERFNIKGLIHHFFDIKSDHNPPEKNRWDVHDSWEDTVKGYDLVIALRLAYLIQSSSGLVNNLRHAVENNKRVLMDFNTGNLSKTQDQKLVQSWKEGSTNLIPHFPALYPQEMSYSVSSEEQLLTIEMLEASGLTFRDPKTFIDPIKGRYYTITEIIKI